MEQNTNQNANQNVNSIEEFPRLDGKEVVVLPGEEYLLQQIASMEITGDDMIREILVEEKSVEEIVEEVLGIGSSYWTISDRKDDLVCIIPSEKDLTPDYRSTIIDIKDKVIVNKFPAVERVIHANQVIQTKKGLAFHSDRGRVIDSLDLEEEDYQIIEGYEGVILRIFKWKDVVYFSTFKMLDARTAKWKNKSFYDMYLELGGITGEEIFKDVDSEFTSINLMIIHPLLQNILHGDIGLGCIKLFSMTSTKAGGVNLPPNTKMIDYISIDQMNDILSPEFIPEMFGGFAFIHVLDKDMGIRAVYEIRSSGYQWRHNIRGLDSDPKAALWKCIDQGARPIYVNLSAFADKYFIGKHLNKKKLDHMASGEYELTPTTFYSTNKAPDFLGTNKNSNEADTRRAFLKRLEIVIANWLYCLPPHQRKNYVGIFDKIFLEVHKVVERVRKYINKEMFFDDKTPKRMKNLTSIWKDDRRMNIDLVYELLLKERYNSLDQMTKYINC